ncbi:ArsR/SmtB family transcription factor [Liquorilactobacillus satsumensis]|uniref:ArsR/SmtB family transcription factor n=1 Tax=Liquorilactobacillus satsumensis TaxID=259059 RepID=UPI0006D2B0C3|nr:metalloregulator ArsR/SmtB family transcription factor [Liquorilactobacillus satsumensis]MCC7667278.1 ArsR family transcriptional regulator [Liquorilactobacillus satsumensis]MCP9312618.1 winged helix-turn-helix transcriptional regulator [Liquorilactobacillus satsumensis]MCP9327604.1 winged helix-turn-helix transcriptional regulator [Liquorilactobacillus satsumensis]MCP9357124.1 winged helix-turn-helix transcriptional regulator [Liquorilactobacillus satsumensis]MCP9361065.1 winged helix-turn
MNIKLSDNDFRRAEIFKCLSDPNRLQLIRLLYKNKKEMSCTELGEHLNLTLSTVSYHFKALRLAGLTNTIKDGRTKYVSLRYETFAKFLPGFLETLLID